MLWYMFFSGEENPKSQALLILFQRGERDPSSETHVESALGRQLGNLKKEAEPRLQGRGKKGEEEEGLEGRMDGWIDGWRRELRGEAVNLGVVDS